MGTSLSTTPLVKRRDACWQVGGAGCLDVQNPPTKVSSSNSRRPRVAEFVNLFVRDLGVSGGRSTGSDNVAVCASSIRGSPFVRGHPRGARHEGLKFQLARLAGGSSRSLH